MTCSGIASTSGVDETRPSHAGCYGAELQNLKVHESPLPPGAGAR